MADERHDWLWGRDGVPPPHANRKRGQTCLVVGSAACVWGDLAALDGYTFDHRLAVNYASLVLRDKMDGLCTLHVELGQALRTVGLGTTARMKYFVPLHGQIDDPNADVPWAFASCRATSGLFGVRVALGMGFDKIVLAGMPFTDTGHFYDPPGTTLESGGLFVDSAKDISFWRAGARLFNDRVRSVSGWTAEIFGKPTKEWFDGQ